MAAERDEAGPSGLSGTGRDYTEYDVGTPRPTSMGDAPGNADVHAGIAFNANAGADQGLRERTMNRVKDVAGEVADAAGSLGGRARTVASDVADRAGDFASRARDRVGVLADRAQSTLEERGWLDRLKENPLPALGVAFAAGFLLAGGSTGGSGEGGGTRGLRGGAGRVRGELRGALAAGLSAGLAQGARAFLRNVGAEDGVINSVMQNLPGRGEDEYGSGGGQPSRSRNPGGRMGSTGGGRGGQYADSGGPQRSGGGTSGGPRRATQGGMQGGTAQRHREPSHRESL